MAAKRVRSDAKSKKIKKIAKIIYGDHDDHRISQTIYGDGDHDDHRISQTMYGGDDRISQLPEDIILQILCCLSLKQAVVTSVLSSRWQDLWKQMQCLNFDKHSCLKRIPPVLESCRVKRKEYVKWVNRIIRSHTAVVLKEFRIRLNLSRTFQKEITQWLRYALLRRVQRLEFDLTLNCSSYRHCSFPKVFFTEKYSSKIDFKSLRVLSLKSISVTNEDIGLFLSKCTSLEELVVDRSYEISNLEVCGPSLALKRLELTRCYNFKSLKLSAPNLTSLDIRRVKELLIENVPKLVEVTLRHMYNDALVKDTLPAFSCCLFQLEILTIELAYHEEIFPELLLPPALKKLVVIKTYRHDFELSGMTDLIEASPYLQEFCLDLKCLRRTSNSDSSKQVKTIKFRHEYLRLFKFCGYCGQDSEVEILTYIVVNCVALKKVIISPDYERLYDCVPQHPDESITRKQAVKDYVKQTLKAHVPRRRIELVVL